MKKKIYRSLCVISLLVAAACSDDLTNLNNDPKAYETVPGATLFSNAVRNLTDAVVYGVTFKVLAQQWAETTYTDASRYNLPNVGNAFWNSLYRDVLKDLQEGKRLISQEVNATGDPTFLQTQENRIAIIDIVECYTYVHLVNTYGHVPYAKALDITNLQPTYDDAEAIYNDIFERLKKDAATLADGGVSFADGADLVYDGSTTRWILFANSLRFKMAVTLSDVRPAKAQTEAQLALAAGLFRSNADNAIVEYLDTPPNTNQIWVNLVQSGREDYVASNTLIDLMKGIDSTDVRIPNYFAIVIDTLPGFYKGGVFGSSNNFKNSSHVSDKVIAQDFPGDLLDYSEIKFFVAEAAARNLVVGQDVVENYEDAIIASIEFWGGTEDTAKIYLAKPKVAFATAPGTALQKIATQKYIALYNRGLEAWTEYRRLDYPVLNKPKSPLGDFPSRYTYPVNEQNLNESSWQDASARLGGEGDVVTNRVFWDTK